MRRYNRRRYAVRDTEEVIVMIILGVIAMPLVGAYMLFTDKDSSKKAIGAVLLILGIGLWICCGSH